MAGCMGQEEHLVAQITMHRHKDVGAVKEQDVLKAPRHVEVARLQLLEVAAAIIGACSCAANVIEEAERRPRESMSEAVIFVLARKSISHHVEATRVVLHSEIKGKKLADPLMLRHCGQALIQQSLQAVVIHPHKEVAPPQVRAPVTYGQNKADQLAFVGCELEMTNSEGPTELRYQIDRT